MKKLKKMSLLTSWRINGFHLRTRCEVEDAKEATVGLALIVCELQACRCTQRGDCSIHSGGGAPAASKEGDACASE
jgi:hypothetical protein